MSGVGRAALFIGLWLLYFGPAFQLWGGAFWTAGVGDWLDPYFINYLLEHWFHSVTRLTDPSSPPMFHPVTGTLGYSHGLILFVPFYVPLRLFLHPFQAHNGTLLLVVLTGTLCLFELLRRHVRLSSLEALLLTASFATSANVMSGVLGVWSQRASVFLVPPILLVILAGVRRPAGGRQAALAFCGGLLATLLFTQDFYSAQFALVFTIAGAVLIGLPAAARMARRFWTASPGAAKAALAAGLAAAAWTAYVMLSGGGTLVVAGVRIRSSDWRRPALVALCALGAVAWLHRGRITRPRIPGWPPWLIPMAAGALAGCALFAWIYLPVYREFPGFPQNAFDTFLVIRPSSSLWDPVELFGGQGGFATFRPFLLVLALGLIALISRADAGTVTRTRLSWALVVSAVVFLVPFRVGGFSIWEAIFYRLPGFNAIRDPVRIIYLYELAVVLAAGLLVARLRRPAARLAASAAVLVVMLATPNTMTFDFLRPNQQYERWVAAPINIAASCRSFFMTAGPADYTSRSPEPWSLYSIDAMFVSLRHSIPTLHGYSAFTPAEWRVRQPHDPEYADGLRLWITAHGLDGVCAFDVTARTMQAGVPAARARLP